MWYKLVWIALGGMCGATSRYLVSEAMKLWLTARFPWGTLTVNMIGSFCMGLLFALCQKQLLTNEHARLFLMVGFLGSFTTFSSFALDNIQLMRTQSMAPMLLNIGIQNIVGLLLVVGGISLGLQITKAQ